MSSQAATRGAVQFHAASSSSRQAASTASGKALCLRRASDDANASDALSASDASSLSAAAISRIASRVSDSSKAEKHCSRFVSRASAVRARKATVRRFVTCDGTRAAPAAATRMNASARIVEYSVRRSVAVAGARYNCVHDRLVPLAAVPNWCAARRRSGSRAERTAVTTEKRHKQLTLLLNLGRVHPRLTPESRAG